MVKDAPVAIAVCGDEREQRHKGFWVQDCAAATENLLLAAHAKGLGAVWVGLFPAKERTLAIKKLLDIPEHVTPLSLIPLGYPAEEKPPANRYLKSRIHHDKW